MTGYMKKAKDMTDEEVVSWVKNFRSQPPTMDYFSEFCWAESVVKEAARREIEVPR